MHGNVSIRIQQIPVSFAFCQFFHKQVNVSYANMRDVFTVFS
jgi:hypothetical protein